MDEIKEKINEWLKDFIWGEDESGLWEKANQNGARILLENLFEDKLFLTVEHNKKTGDFNIEGIFGPIGFRVKKNELEEILDYSDDETMHTGYATLDFDGEK